MHRSHKTGSFLHSDDYGYQPYNDERIFTLLESNKLRSISVLSSMIRGKTVDKLPLLAQYQPQVKVGLHINVTEGKSLEKKATTRTLTSKGGNFFSFWIFLFLLAIGMIKKEDIRAEITAQIRFLLDAGIRPDMIDSHQHIHAFSPVAEIVHDLAQTYHIQHTRSYNTVKTFTYSAKLTYLLLKLGAFLSHVIAYRQAGMPESWKSRSPEHWSFMDWEGERFDIEKQRDKKTVYVIHPFLSFDTNTSYAKLL